MTSQEIVQRTPQALATKLRSPESQEQLEMALDGSGISVRRFTRIALTAFNENPELAEADERSVFSALVRCASDYLVPDGREAAMAIFNTKMKIDGRDAWVKKAQYMPMYGGILKRLAEHGFSVFSALIYENDAFDPDYETHRANHKPTRLGHERGALIGAYAVAEHKDGRRFGPEVIDKAGIDKIRNVSRAKDRGPWVDWYEQMAEIRPVKRLAKKLPLDPKDRERIDRVLAAAGEDGIVELYGHDSSREPHSEDDRAPATATISPGGQEPAAAGGSGSLPRPPAADIDGEATEVPFDGEEPPPVQDEPTFPTTEYAGKQLRYAGKTLSETLAAGDDGVTFLRWAFKAWKTEPLRSALDAFAEQHPEIRP